MAHSEKGIVMQFCPCAHITEGTYRPRGLLLSCHQPGWQATVLRTLGNYSAMGSDCISAYRKVTVELPYKKKAKNGAPVLGTYQALTDRTGRSSGCQGVSGAWT